MSDFPIELHKGSLEEANDSVTWKLDKDIVIKAAEEVSKYSRLNFKPEEYFSQNSLRSRIEDALNDPAFSKYYNPI